LGFNRRAINLHEACKQISSAIKNEEDIIKNYELRMKNDGGEKDSSLRSE
jgi:hypothetical protein